jgi:hypothetical protein
VSRSVSGRSRARLRLLAGVAAFMAGSACANQALPPGGPPDVDSPVIVKVTPEHEAIISRPRDVELRFDEVISESPRGGARDLRELVFISPRSGQPRVSWGRTRLTIRPSKGWKPNTVYSIQIKPGIQDLRNNGIDTTIRLVFSTGGPIPRTQVTGVAFDWPAGKGLSGAVIEAIAPDSTIYQAVADSAGRYELRYLPPGPYLMRAFGDRNSSGELDPLELWDTVRVTLTERASAEFHAFGHDTVGLRIAGVEVLDSNRVLKVTFDKPFSPTQAFPLDSVRLFRPDSSRLFVRQVQTSAEKLLADSLAKKAATDSIARAAAAKGPKIDSTPAMRARADSIQRVRRQDSLANAAATARRARLEAERAARARGVRYVPPDTTPPPKMSRPPVYTSIFVTLDSTLRWQTAYRLEVRGVRSLSEVQKAPSRGFTTARQPKVDSTARRDTVARRDTTRRDTTRRDSAAVAPVRRDTLGAPRPRRR